VVGVGILHCVQDDIAKKLLLVWDAGLSGLKPVFFVVPDWHEWNSCPSRLG
jgi:hypothetical protein